MKNTKIYTLVFIKRNNFILLGYKTRGIGEGLWNGFGGKVEQGESIIDAARRELKEESNLEVGNLKHVGTIIYEIEHNECISLIHVFTACETKGTIKVSEEMDPIRWFHFEDVPFYKMWPDSSHWYPIMLRDKIFTVYVIYNSHGKLKQQLIYEYDAIEKALQDVDNLIKK